MIIFKKPAGFTLIELLVVISIVLLTTGAGIAGFVNFNDRQQVQTTVKDVQELMRSAQVKARAGEGADSCAVNRKLKGYRVSVSGNFVQLHQMCVLATNPSDVVAVTPPRSQLSLDNISVSMTPVTFLALRGGVDTGGVGNMTIIVSGQYSSLTYQFQVLATGEITDGAFVSIE